MGAYENTKKHIDFIINFGGIYSAIATFLTDFFKPVFDSTIVCLFIASLFLCVIVVVELLKFISPIFAQFNKFLIDKTQGYWFISIFLASVLCVILFSIMAYINKNKPDGYFASKSTTIQALQNDLGLIHTRLSEISKYSQQTSENTREIAEEATKISTYASQIANDTSHIAKSQEEHTQLMRESVKPTDPKAKLAKIGLRFDSRNFAQKVMEGDLESLKLFYESGMNPNIILNDNTNPIYSSFLQESNNFIEVFKQAVEYGFDPNIPLRIDFRNQLGYSLDEYISSNVFPNLNKFIRNFRDKVDEHRSVGDGTNTSVTIFYPQPYTFSSNEKFNLGSLICFSNLIPNDELKVLLHEFKIDLALGIRLRNEIIKTIRDSERDYSHEYSKELQFNEEVLHDFVKSILSCNSVINLDKERNIIQYLVKDEITYWENIINSCTSLEKATKDDEFCVQLMDDKFKGMHGNCRFVQEEYNEYFHNVRYLQTALKNRKSKIKQLQSQFDIDEANFQKNVVDYTKVTEQFSKLN